VQVIALQQWKSSIQILYHIILSKNLIGITNSLAPLLPDGLNILQFRQGDSHILYTQSLIPIEYIIIVAYFQHLAILFKGDSL